MKLTADTGTVRYSFGLKYFQNFQKITHIITIKIQGSIATNTFSIHLNHRLNLTNSIFVVYYFLNCKQGYLIDDAEASAADDE